MKKAKLYIAEHQSDETADTLVFLDEEQVEHYCNKENPYYSHKEAWLVVPEVIDEVATHNLGIGPLLLFAHHSIDINVAEIAMSVKHTYQGKEYYSRMAVQTYETNGKRMLEEMATDIADKIYSSNLVFSDVTYKELLQKAVLAGYNMHQNDMDD